jgi:hypothetical protein
LAWPTAFLSHFLLDYVPHLDSHALFGRPGGLTFPETIMGLIDGLVGIGLVLWIVRGQPARRVMLGAATFAILIDVLDNALPWGAWFRVWSGTAWLSAFHHGFQHNLTPAQWPLGVVTQGAVVALALWICLRGRRRPAERRGPLGEEPRT